MSLKDQKISFLFTHMPKLEFSTVLGTCEILAKDREVPEV